MIRDFLFYGRCLIFPACRRFYFCCMKKVILFFIVMLIVPVAVSQEISKFIPFQGFKLTTRRVSYKSVAITLDELKWTSNKLPAGKTFKILIEEPKGFAVKKGKVLPGVSVLFTKTNSDTLGYAGNMLGDDFSGIHEEFFSSLNVKLAFKEDVEEGDTIFGKVVFYDRNSDKFVSLEGNYIITSGGHLDQSSRTYRYFSDKGLEGESTGIHLYGMDWDIKETSGSTSIATLSLNAKGLSVKELRNSDMELQVLDKNGKIRAVSDYQLLTEETDNADAMDLKITVQIPFEKTTLKDMEAFWVRFTDKDRQWSIAGSVIKGK